jgi:hypothetical protein
MSVAVAAERIRLAAPEHAAWAEHRCDDCRPGLSCPARLRLRELADDADLALIGGGGAR